MNFDLATTPLSKGVTRLEASAGTGKTFTLAGLFLRLLLQEKVSPREILVVTFTEAATAELRDRIRQRLSEALAALQGRPTTDTLLVQLAKELGPQPRAAIASLRNALEVFDLVSIYTIHGFCQRTLQDSAFESGTLFDMELMPDQEELVREVAADYCRRHLHGCDELMASVALEAKLTPDALTRLLKQFLTYPELHLVTGQPLRPLSAIAEEIRTRFALCLDAWKSLKTGCDDVVDHFIGGPKWAVKEHAQRQTLLQHAENLRGCLDSANLSPEFWAAIDFFSTTAIQRETGKGKHSPPPLPLFGHCEALAGLVGEYTTAHRLDFLQSAGGLLAKAKQQAKQQSFDDLISRLAHALESPSGAALADSVRRRFRAALIDESQDTDALQWKIFERVFARSPEHWLCLIGDPKQAIYAFRGADVNTYLQAAATAQQAYSLGTNWRSESALVHAVNALFSSTGKTAPFLEEEIPFEVVSPGPKADSAPITFAGGQRPPPFQVWCWEGPDGTVTSKEAQRTIPGAVAAEISRLLSGKVLLGEIAIQPRDIAILVESHKQARWIQSALHPLGIPSVEQAMESVFDSTEARELQWLLAAILTPSRDVALKSALTTDILGFNATRLQASVADEGAWQARLQTFVRYRQAWEDHGFFSMFIRLLRQEQVIENLLRFPDAERRVTNLLHLAELLEAAGKAEHLGPSRLGQWLEERRGADEAAGEEFQLRLESDEDAVQIITIHRAKGLEYPVVFCPFISKDAKLRAIRINGQKVMDVVLYHDPATGKLSWDMSAEPDAVHSRLAVREQLAEKVRLLYVALTRARNRSYLVSAPYARNPSTALAWLLRRADGVPEDIVQAFTSEKVQPGMWKNRWQEMARASAQNNGGKPGISVDDLPIVKGERWYPSGSPTAESQARICPRTIELSWFLSSFSQLANQVSLRSIHDGETGFPDHDEQIATLQPDLSTVQPALSPTGIFALPASARTGDCLHRILERVDLAEFNPDEVRTLVHKELDASNLSQAAHGQAVIEMLERLRLVRFDPGDPSSTLAQTAPSQRLAELEFHFPTTHLDGRKLLGLIRSTDTLAHRMGEGRGEGSFPHGFLKGFIDLVFVVNGRYHIVDWKSNLLGLTTADFTPEAMQSEIIECDYDLQYHLYTVAVDKFLRQRLPGYEYDLHFGGVHYVFLRGLDPARPELGVFHDRPPRARIDRLSSLLGQFGEAKP